MSSAVTKDALLDLFRRNGYGDLIDGDRADRFEALAARMLEVNENLNLTAITDPRLVMLEHFLDCAPVAALLPEGARLLDVGCGGGFPTLPIAILRPDVSLTAIDSTAKKADYVRKTATVLGLSHVEVLAVRAEELLSDSAYRERFDVVVARAVARLPILSELCLPGVKVGGLFCAMKGRAAEEEVAEAKEAIRILGGTVEEIREISLTDGIDTVGHPLVLVRKTGKTPTLYPRPFAKIKKSPLGL